MAGATGLSRRAADQAILAGRVRLNGEVAQPGSLVAATDQVRLDGLPLKQKPTMTLIMLHKPTGYVVSRAGQGSPTIYELLPAKFNRLKPIGRLDKDSSGLLLLTDDGQLAEELTHPKFAKQKVYDIALDKPLSPEGREKIGQGIRVENYTSRLELTGSGKSWEVRMHEGKNRQIRRTFAALGYTVTKLHRVSVGKFALGSLEPGKFKALEHYPASVLR